MTDAIERILGAENDLPHAVLGPHPVANQAGYSKVRAFLPFAKTVKLQLLQPSKRTLSLIHI